MLNSFQPFNFLNCRAGEKKSIRKIDSMEMNKDGDPGVKSETEEDVQTRPKPSLGRTPNHLSLSTTSTLSTGSSSSQARLVQVFYQKHFTLSDADCWNAGLENTAELHSGGQAARIPRVEATRQYRRVFHSSATQ